MRGLERRKGRGTAGGGDAWGILPDWSGRNLGISLEQPRLGSPEPQEQGVGSCRSSQGRQRDLGWRATAGADCEPTLAGRSRAASIIGKMDGELGGGGSARGGGLTGGMEGRRGTNWKAKSPVNRDAETLSKCGFACRGNEKQRGRFVDSFGPVGRRRCVQSVARKVSSVNLGCKS
jgi:hypothetical protein